jgi:molybdenum cofactor cytidylyltransferase
MNRQAIAGIILSAGASRRMGTPKALLRLHGATFLESLLAAFRPTCQPLIVALGYDAERIREAISNAVPVQFVVNPDPARGMFSSLQCALRALPSYTEAAIFTPVDYPEIRPATVASLAQAFDQHQCPVTLPRHAGEHGHPVCISRAVIDELLALPATAQARDVIRAYRSGTRFVDVDDPGILSDIDIPEDYRRLAAAAAVSK